MFIPYQFASLVIGKELTAREAFKVLYPEIADANLEQACMPLLQFLMVAYNFLKGKAGCLNTGAWSTKAIKEAGFFGEAVELASSKDKGSIKSV